VYARTVQPASTKPCTWSGMCAQVPFPTLTRSSDPPRPRRHTVKITPQPTRWRIRSGRSASRSRSRSRRGTARTAPAIFRAARVPGFLSSPEGPAKGALRGALRGFATLLYGSSTNSNSGLDLSGVLGRNCLP
jgi:hypothetical protein